MTGVDGADPDRSPSSRRRLITIFAITASAVLAADIATKVMAVQWLSDREPVRLLGGGLYLVFTTNSGAAFNLGSNSTMLLSVAAMLVVAAVVVYSRRLGSRPWAVALGLILGGTSGNLVDRLFRSPGPLEGRVVDFLSLFDDAGQVWPVFNLADASLVCGVGLVILLELTGRRINGSSDRGGKAES